MENKFHSVIYNGASSVFSVIVRTILASFIGIYVVRYLGPQSFGIYAYTLGVIQLFFMLFSTGFLGVIVREISKAEIEDNVIFSSSLTAQFILLLLSSFLVFIYVIFFKEQNYYAFYILGTMSVFMLYLSTPNNGVFSGKEKLYVKSLIETLKTVLNFVFIIVFLVFLKEGPLSVLFASFLSNLLFFILGLIYLNKTYQLAVSLKVDTGYLKRVFFPVLSFSLIGILGYIYGQIDIVMIKHLLEIESVGVYSAAVRIYSLITSMIVSLSAIGYPVICKAIHNKELNEIFIFDIYYKLMLLIVSYIIYICICYSSEIFSLLLGNAYNSSVIPFKILSVSFLFVSLNIVVQQAIYSYEKEKLFIYLYLFLSIVNIVLNFIFLPLIGIIAAALSTFICHMIIAVVLSISFRKYCKNVSIFSLTTIKVIVFLLFMILLAKYFFINNWFLSLAVTSIIYIGILGVDLLKIFNKEERSFFVKNLRLYKK